MGTKLSLLVIAGRPKMSRLYRSNQFQQQISGHVLGTVGHGLQQAACSLDEKEQNLPGCFQSHKPNAPFLLSRDRVNKIKRRKPPVKCICNKKTNKGKVIFSKLPVSSYICLRNENIFNIRKFVDTIFCVDIIKVKSHIMSEDIKHYLAKADNLS